jgi:glycosyltransferase involved in cell wall biosynthesis
MKISVVIATHNRRQSLERTLQSICNLAWPLADLEVIVTLSACSDGSADTVARFARHLSLKVVEEMSPGLSRARNLALDHCKADLVLFLDDDVTADPGLARAYAACIERNPQCSFFGGAIDIRLEGTPQPLIRDVARILPSTYSGLWLGAQEQELDPMIFQTPFGANMAIRRDALQALRFDETLGRNGTSGPIGGEEVKLFMQLAREGHKGCWVPDARVDHWIDSGRQTMDYVRRYWRQAGALQMRLGRRDETSARLPTAKKLRLLARLALYRSAGRPNLWLPVFRELEQEAGRLGEIARSQDARPAVALQ